MGFTVSLTLVTISLRRYMNSEMPKMRRLVEVGRAFRPAAPVDDIELFAGRQQQRGDVMGAIAQPGYHVGLYGERGVGKTSLARVLAAIFDQEGLPQYQASMVNCNSDDTYESMWHNVFRYLNGTVEEFSPEGVRYAVEQLDPPALIVIDELDRLEDDASLTLLADTIKTLSDNAVPSTVVLVGVASSVGELIGEHESIVRNIAQIEMPRMSPAELRDVLIRGCTRAEMTISSDAVDRIVTLSEGLPHYTHLLGFKAAERVVQDDRSHVTLPDVEAAIPAAVARHTIENDYLSAIRSSQPTNLYRQVLLACALAPKDSLGYFGSRQVRDALEVVTGRRIDIPAFSKHMNEFLSYERGSVLRREGRPRSYSYRFRDSMMQPYVILTALSDKTITDEQIDRIVNGPKPPEPQPTKSADLPSEPQRLF